MSRWWGLGGNTPRLCKTTAAHPFGEEGKQGREGAEGRGGEIRGEEGGGGQGRRKEARTISFPFSCICDMHLEDLVAWALDACKHIYSSESSPGDHWTPTYHKTPRAWHTLEQSQSSFILKAST